VPEIAQSAASESVVQQRTEELFQQRLQVIYKSTDRQFAGLMLFQWVAGIVAALTISPLSWQGRESQTHPHVWLAIFLGGAITIFPVALAFLQPGKAITRYTIGAAQMLMSGLLIHLSGGRIETHFHIFGSLAFLAYYRDWRVLIPATIVTGLDHFIRGMYWPDSIYGVMAASPWRTLEHVAWVAFEDIVLIAACIRSLNETRSIAGHTAQLEVTNQIIEDKVVQRTAEVVESEERFRLLMDGVPDYAIVMLDAQGRVISWNEGAKRIHGYTANEIIGKSASQFYAEDECEDGKLEQVLESARATGRLEDEGWRVCKDGTRFWANVVLTALYDTNGQLRGFSKVTRDITDRKRTDEELLAAKEAAEDASIAKSQFLANMSHEIRTPMNGVLGPMGLLLDSKLTGQQRELTEIARSSAESLLGIINDILDLSKIEVGKLDIEPIPFQLLMAVEETASMMAGRAEEKGLDLIVRCPPEVPRAVVGDPGRIRQVLANLVSNAIKFTAQGHVLINIENEAQTAGEVTLCFTVEDSGIGIAPDKIEHVFGRFNQADTSTTRRYGGTGLGLSISRQLVELMGGEIGADSTPSEGSKFWFRLRLPLQSDAPVIEMPDANLDDVRILIVDDNAVNRLVLHEQLNNWRLRNDSCASSKEALEILRAAQAAGDPYQIAILDHQMPDMDGEMLGKVIKADPLLSDIVLVMLTSLGHKGDAVRLKAAGFAAYLVKPARQSELLGTLVNVWNSHNAHVSSELVTRHSLAESQHPHTARRWDGTRVLVVEDNIVNQKVATMILQSFGCRVEVAANGREALTSIDALPFDVVFMDCEMPEMDGYEATAEIRRRDDDKRELPIIALTAKATKGDRERCLESGMDDYMSKPVRSEDIQAVLERWASNGEGDKAGASPAAPESSDVKESATAITDNSSATAAPALDAEVVARLRTLAESTDASLLNQIFEAFNSDGEARLETMRGALGTGDAESLRKSAHALKGASANIGARQMAGLAQELQALGEAGTVEGAAVIIDQLETEFERVQTEIVDQLKP